MWEGHWLAASVPGWTPDGAFVSTGYQRVFCPTRGVCSQPTAPTPSRQDSVDGKEDVYEYQPAGVGCRCQPPSYGQSASDVFSQGARWVCQPDLRRHWRW